MIETSTMLLIALALRVSATAQLKPEENKVPNLGRGQQYGSCDLLSGAHQGQGRYAFAVHAPY